MTKLRIALVTETYPPEINGVAMTLSRWAEGLQSLGHSLELWRPQPLADINGLIRRDGGFIEHRVAGYSLPMYPELRVGQPSRRRLCASWRNVRPDLLYIATEGPLGWSALHAGRHLGIPIVSGFHTRFDLYSDHYRMGLLTPLVRRYLRRFHLATSLTLAPTQQLSASLEEDGFGRIAVIPRGVDTTLFTPERRNLQLRRSWGLEDSDLAVLMVGRVAKEKNIDEAIDAFRGIQTRQPRARMIVVGDGPQRTTLARMHPDIIFTGAQRGVALAEHYASADMFVFPSRTETFGNVTLEAMASGLPVVAFDYAAAALHLRHGISGFLAPYAGPSQFVTHSCELGSDAALRHRMGNAARTIAERLDWGHVVLDLEALFIQCAQTYKHS